MDFDNAENWILNHIELAQKYQQFLNGLPRDDKKVVEEMMIEAYRRGLKEGKKQGAEAARQIYKVNKNNF
ncbi:hypothetical protein [Pseudalkalibacillus caeni]|uniref:Uncharacterized protein n=1 Tax=Exobacillus caeni TaxID=2574798 RepID=A0A5R9F5G4_9BACL|nr:hypothetical protein [Pseudalkalibacillus caeni]TLS37576.1 hypothetical protein FCL54_10580 [Pseudalkalibacillus caeni]